MPLIVLLNRYSVVLVIPQNNRRSTARFVRHTCGNLKRGSETLNSKLAALAPVTVFGLYASGFGLNGRVFVLSILSNPVFIRGIAARVPDAKRLERLRQARDVHVSHLEPPQRHR